MDVAEVDRIIEQISKDLRESLSHKLGEHTDEEVEEFCRASAEFVANRYSDHYMVKREDLDIEVKYDEKEKMLNVTVMEKPRNIKLTGFIRE